MGPIMQEHTASTTLKRIVAKDKIRVKNTENSGPVTSSKKGNKMKKAVSQMKNGLPGPGQDKDTGTTVQKAAQSNGGRIKCGSSRNPSKLSSPEDGDSRPPLRKHSSVQRKEEKPENQRMSQCGNELQPNRAGMGKSRRALSLPLSPISGLRHMPMHPLTHSPAPTPEALRRHYNQKDDDTDSASDLSDSERLPVLPSPCTPCTPPHLNLRAEVINSEDFPPEIPGPHGTLGDEDESEKPSYSYQEFLPPPFNSWSLRQLAVFLHTEGRGAPRPKPVGTLEKYLERLLQLEWLQIQTVQAESSRPPGTRTRPQSFPSATTAHQTRPHTAPPSRLNSPKGLRQSQRAFPFAPVNNPPSPASNQHQLSRFPVCPHCHVRYPMCNGSCSAYAYQRHSRLSPLLERRAGPGAPAKRSSSETRAPSNDGRSPGGPGGGGGGAQTPVSPSAGKGHLRHMQAAGNARKQPQESGTNPNCRGQVRKSRVRANSETDVKKVPGDIKGASAEKRVLAASKREVITSKRVEKQWQRAEVGGQATKTSMKRAAKEPPLLSKAPLSNKQNGKTKNVHFVAK
ncbi:centrosomal protein of 170 kDa protein B [Platichthys flesus]|uniref:centrosomal protein of 170 kDa protein B n=1 Tax=Platichthys flesus TaxID=8260 RepID=UPI002DC03D50|nr:centrosomal protein of 170 kDa protein B [Platichthys flesus]